MNVMDPKNYSYIITLILLALRHTAQLGWVFYLKEVLTARSCKGQGGR